MPKRDSSEHSSDHPFSNYTRQDRRNFVRYANREHQHKPVFDLAADSDDVLVASLTSAQIYMANCFGTRNRVDEAFRVFPGYVECLTPNAFAWRERATHVCGMHTGLVASTFEFALFCFCQKEFLPHIGDVSEESSPAPRDGCAPGFWIAQNFGAIPDDAFKASSQFLMPAHPRRFAAANYLCQLMLRFVWFHELYHCLNGHVDFARSRGRGSYLHEHEDPYRASSAVEYSHALEFDADQTALWACCGIQIKDTENIAGIRSLERADRLRLTLFAAYAILWLLQEYSDRIARPHVGTHPAPYGRLHFLLRAFHLHIAPRLSGLQELNNLALSDMDVVGSIIPSFIHGKRVLEDLSWERMQAHVKETGEQTDQAREYFSLFGYL